MDHAELRAKAENYFRALLEEGKRRRSSKGPFSEKDKANLLEAIEWREMDNKDYWQLMPKGFAREQLDRFCDGAGVDQPTSTDDTWLILNEIRIAQLAQFKTLLEHGLSLESYDFSEPPRAALSALVGAQEAEAAQPVAAAPADHSAPLLSELFAQRLFEAEQSGEWSHKLKDDYQVWTSLFIELQGDRAITEYRKADARDFKSALLALPSNRGKHPRTKGLSARDAIDAAKQHNLPTLSNSTINKALGRMQATWKWAARQLDTEVTDIFGPMKLASRGNARSEADPFSASQLNLIFNSPLFTGCKSQRFRTAPGSTDMSRTSWYWLPLLGLWTGARLNELCQLRVDDIDSEDGIAFIRVQAGDETQRVKFGKKRLIPIHPELLRLGFTRFVKDQAQSGHERIFPTLSLGATGYYSDQSSKDFSRYIANLGAKTNKTSFHSFRHNFKDACRHGGVNLDINDILLGHALPGMAARYGDGSVPLPVLNKAIGKVAYRGLSLAHIAGFR